MNIFTTSDKNKYFNKYLYLFVIIRVIRGFLFCSCGSWLIHTQHAIVSEIEAEQKAVDGCRELIALYEGKIMTVIERVWGKDSEEA